MCYSPWGRIRVRHDLATKTATAKRGGRPGPGLLLFPPPPPPSFSPPIPLTLLPWVVGEKISITQPAWVSAEWMDLGQGEKSQHSRVLGFDQRIHFRFFPGSSPVVKTHASTAGGLGLTPGRGRSDTLPSMAKIKNPVQIPASELSLWTSHFFELLFIASRMQGGLSRPQRVVRVHSELGLPGHPWPEHTCRQ